MKINRDTTYDLTLNSGEVEVIRRALALYVQATADESGKTIAANMAAELLEIIRHDGDLR